MKIEKSPSDALSPALTHMWTMLFTRFSLEKWLWLGVVGFFLGGGGGGNFPGGGGGGPGGGGPGGGPGGPGPDFGEFQRDASRWFAENSAWLLPAAGIAAVVFLFVILFFMYMAARMTFVMLDCVARDRVQIREALEETGPEATSYFYFSIVLAVVGGVTVLVLGGLIALPFILGAEAAGVGVAIVVGLLLVAAVLALAIAGALTHDFAVPIQYARRMPTMEAWSILWPYVKDNVGGFVVYYILKIVIGIAFAIATIFLAIVPCCVCIVPSIAVVAGAVALFQSAGPNPVLIAAAIPVGILWMIALMYSFGLVKLPALVFDRAYALHYLEGFGPEYQILARFKDERGF